MSRTLTRLQSAILGFLVILTLGLGGAALLLLNERTGWGADNLRVAVALNDVNGVEVGTRVRIQGIDAGEIETIVPPEAPGEKVKLQLRINGKYRHLVREDARVQIGADNLFAGKVVRIVPGAPGANAIADGGELQADVQPDVLEGIAQAANKLNKLLSEVDDSMQAFRQSEGTVTQDLISAAKKLNAVLTKADSALASIEKGEGSLGKLVKDDKLYDELSDAVTQVKAALNDVRSGEGTLGKLVKTNDAYAEAMASLQDVRRMVNSVKQNSDAIKALPVVRNYVVDHAKELLRPECKCYSMSYKEEDLFVPGKAVMTQAGRMKLDEAAEFLNKHKYEGSEILIAAFAEPSQQADFALTVTQKQAEVVLEQLRSVHKVHSTGWWWWSTRPTRSIGCGNAPSPVPGADKLPPARIDVMVFVPQK